MIPNRERTNAIGLAGGGLVAVSAPTAPGKKTAPGRGRPAPSPVTSRFPALLGLCALLLPGSGFSLYLLQRQGTLEREIRAVREQMEGRIQKLDAGITFDSKRRQLLLGIRDEIMAANKRLGPERAYEYSSYLLTTCEKYPAVDPLLLLAIGIAESGYDAMAQSPARARGLYQIWPSTGRMLAGMLGWQYTDGMLHDPGKNTAMAALYLHLLFTAYNDESLVLAEYNGGPLNAGYLRAGDKRAAAETRRYVAKVLDLHERLRTKLEPGEGLPGEETGAFREGGRLAERSPAGAAP